MKTILTLVIASGLFYSCSKCADCKRTYSVMHYKIDTNGHKYDITYDNSKTEEFTACGSDEIEIAEKPQYYSDHNQDTSATHSDTSVYCECVNK